MKIKLKIQAQENNQVCLFGEMTNASALSEKKPPLGSHYDLMPKSLQPKTIPKSQTEIL